MRYKSTQMKGVARDVIEAKDLDEAEAIGHAYAALTNQRFIRIDGPVVIATAAILKGATADGAPLEQRGESSSAEERRIAARARARRPDADAEPVQAG